VAVTFDDGWEDNFRFALPVMRRHGVPATVFLTAGLVGTQRVFWQERLRASALRVADAWRAGVLAESVPLPPAARSAVSARAALDAIDALIEKAKRMAEVERTALLDAVEAAAGGGTGDLYAANRLLTWDEVRAMSAHGVEFGSHGESHAILTRIGAEQLDRELRASRERIERETGRPCTAIAYPNGDYNAAVTAAARKAGYTVGLTVRPGLNMPRTPPFELRRISVADNRFVDETGAFRESMFEAALAGLL
jgi:peptidoglycan/xylan/chitin deacetylase (PgdA/CDA1 family)